MSVQFKGNKSTPISIGILTVSDTRNKETDKSGQAVRKLLEEAGHSVAAYELVADELGIIQHEAQRMLDDNSVQALLITGGTGIAKRDVTIEAITPLFDKEIPGFGEIFRMLSFTEDIGTKALLTRASAGVKNNKVVFVLPGSTGAVTLAMNRLILPELHHITHELQKDN
ncbi:molybdenum cofactor biosynthesis protein B [Bacillus tianshenii]|nr:molybdenum cofactor biosynthesis protein B [Bacillus tianshenii]